MSNDYKTQELQDRVIKIVVQSTRGKKPFSFVKLATIADVIEQAIKVFEFKEGDRFELVLAKKPGEPLEPRRTLASYHIEDESILILTAVGGGV